MRRGGFLVTRIKQVSGRLLERMLAAKGIDAFNGPQGRILFVLWQGDGIPISELSRQTGLATTSLTSMLDRMEALGLVRRERNNKDRRKVLIHLTEKARMLEGDYNEVSDEMNAIFYEGFSEEEAEQLDSYLNRVLANTERHL